MTLKMKLHKTYANFFGKKSTDKSISQIQFLQSLHIEKEDKKEMGCTPILSCSKANQQSSKRQQNGYPSLEKKNTEIYEKQFFQEAPEGKLMREKYDSETKRYYLVAEEYETYRQIILDRLNNTFEKTQEQQQKQKEILQMVIEESKHEEILRQQRQKSQSYLPENRYVIDSSLKEKSKPPQNPQIAQRTGPSDENEKENKVLRNLKSKNEQQLIIRQKKFTDIPEYIQTKVNIKVDEQDEIL